jgi:heme A synthase
MLALALWVLFRSRRDPTGVRPVLRASTAVAALYMIQAALGIAVLAAGDNTTVEVLHSSIGSLTWAGLATLLSLTKTLPQT